MKDSLSKRETGAAKEEQEVPPVFSACSIFVLFVSSFGGGPILVFLMLYPVSALA